MFVNSSVYNYTISTSQEYMVSTTKG